MVVNVNFRQIIAKIDFQRFFHQKGNFFENLTYSCYGHAFFGVTSKSTDLAQITLLVSMESWSADNSNKIQ